MKKFITLLSALLIINSAYAVDNIADLKTEVSNSLNLTVKTLKEYFKKTDEELKQKKIVVNDAKNQAKVLKEASKEKELNVTVLKQGKAGMPTCNSNEELQWNGSKWSCLVPVYGTDCYQASDEYKYEENGKPVCAKTAKGSSINYYWKFRGHERNCNSNARKPKVYGCYYKNKLNVEVEVANNNCSGVGKPGASEYICYASWQTGSWSSCSASCGTGTQSRSVTCQANHICQGGKPASSQSCNAGSCSSGHESGSGSDRDHGGNSGGRGGSSSSGGGRGGPPDSAHGGQF